MSRNNDNIDRIKASVSCRDLFASLYPDNYRGSNGNSICPFHGDSPARPSLSVQEDHVKCFGSCDKHWDVIDLWQAANGLSGKNEAIKTLAAKYGISLEGVGANGGAPSSREKGKGGKAGGGEKKPANPFVSRWKRIVRNKQNIESEAREYLEQARGICPLVVDDLLAGKMLGFDPKWKQGATDPGSGERYFTDKSAVAFPVMDLAAQNLLGIQFIPLDKTDKQFAAKTNAKDGVLRFGSANDHQVVVEAVIDALSVYSASRTSIDLSVWSIYSAGSWNKIKGIPGTVTLFFDNDFSGWKATALALREFGTKLRMVNWTLAPEGMKDANDLLVNGHRDVIERMVRLAPGCKNMEEVGAAVQHALDRMKETARNQQELEQYENLARQIGPGKGGTDGASPSREGQEFPLTQYGNAERLCAAHGAGVRYCHPADKWYCWDGSRWAIDHTGCIERLAKATVRSIGVEAAKAFDDDKRKAILKHALKSESRTEIQSMISLAKSEPGIPVIPEALDQDHWVFNCMTGTIDLRTGGIRPHSKDDLITKMAPVEFIPGAQCPTFMGFLSTILEDNDELIQFLKRAIGSSLTGDTEDQCFFILHGRGSNGKSTFLTIIQELLGDYAATAQFETFIQKNNETIRNDLACLKGVRFVSAIESAKDRTLAEDVVKQLTGGDPVKARFLFKEYFTYTPTAKIWLGTNEKPRIKGSDHAIWRRVKLIPFNVKFEEHQKDKRLKDKLKLEMPGILNWALEGCMEWQRDGIGVPQTVIDATSEYKREQDQLGDFLEDCCIVNPLAKEDSNNLYVAYSRWAEDNNEKVVPKRTFGIWLGERGFKKGRSKDARFWSGIKIFDGKPVLGDSSNVSPKKTGHFDVSSQQVSSINQKSVEKNDDMTQVTQPPAIFARTYTQLKDSEDMCHSRHPSLEGTENNTENRVTHSNDAGKTVTHRCVTRICGFCMSFEPSKMDPENGFGVCLGEPEDGRLTKRPDTKGCKNWNENDAK